MSLLPNYGWVQNTSNLSTIRETIDLVPENGISHLNLRENIREFRVEHGGLPNRWTWDARCRIKAIHATGLVTLNRHIEGYQLTELGRRLKEAPRSDQEFRGMRILSDEEKEIFKEGILTNPPVIRVLKLLYNDYREGGYGLTKYDIGGQLGFAGDIGFTHHDPHWVVRNGFSFNNKEGDSDKWARTIARWLEQVDWVEKGERIEIEGKGIYPYRIKLGNIEEVDRVIRYNIDSVTKNVPAEMLCSQHHPFPRLIKKRRSLVLRILSEKAAVTEQNVVEYVRENGVNIDRELVQFEIINLRQSGFRISEDGGYFKLIDTINLDAPDIEEIEEERDAVERLIEQYVVKCANTIPPLFVDGLIRYGNDGDKHSSFEEKVSEYFRFLGYSVEEYGQGAGATADCLVKYIDDDNYARSYGVIIDAKAASGVYNIPTRDRRSMKEYIRRHGPELAGDNIIRHAFLFVCSTIIDNPNNNLQEISNDTGVNGTAIEVLDLLDLGSKIRAGDYSVDKIYNLYTTNSKFSTL